MNIKNLYLFILLVAGLGYFNVMLEVIKTFWSNDVLMVIALGCTIITSYLTLFESWYKKFYNKES